MQEGTLIIVANSRSVNVPYIPPPANPTTISKIEIILNFVLNAIVKEYVLTAIITDLFVISCGCV
jgi:hypothetical protein